MSAALLDVDYLSAYLDITADSINNAIDAPTAELVRSILEAITTKAREHDELAADKLRVDIELENAIRSSETRIEGLKASVEKAQKTVEEVRTKLNHEENTRSTLETELQSLKSSSTTSTSEAESLRARIATLEAANRDTLAVLESKTTANDELAKDLQKQHQKGLELSQQIATLQQTAQAATSAASSAKFREQSLKQEAELAKRNNEWFENELKTKSAEALKYRKEKGARVAELQRLNDEATSNIDALKKTEQALRTRLDEVQKKAEGYLEKVQQLEEAAAKTEEGFRQELEGSRRLSELQTQQTETHRSRLKDVEAELNKIKDDAAEEIGRARQDAESDKQEREQAENRIAELEAEVDRLEVLVSSHNRPGSVPGTPRQGLNGSMLGRSGSPANFGTPGSVRSKSAVTATQAIEELYKVKGQLATEKRRGDRLTAEMDEMVQVLEAKQPELEELQAEHERLQQEVVEMSKFVDQTGKERDRAKKDARKAENEASTAQAENGILRQQLRDLSAQIKMLLSELDAQSRGLDALSPAEQSQLERLARGEVGEGAFEGLTDTDRLISQRLTVFRSISDLQDKNQELLRVTRQLGAQMESEEAVAAKNQAVKDHEEVQSLLKQIENYKDELQSMLTRSESYVRERDMFRRMLQHRGQLPMTADLASIFGQSVDGPQNGVLQTVEQNSRDNANYAVLLRELQAHFDEYRNEQSIDRRTMKEQIETLSREKGVLQGEIAKIKSQLTMANERHDLLQSNYAMVQKENVEMQHRSQSLSESSAKQDLRTQQVAEDLIEAKGLLESMRNENANLKAEKKLWKDIQDRLNQDNEGLMNERSRLNNLVANQQTLQNERELSDSETRRRLQSQAEALETELSTTKRKLNDEIEDHKKTQLRKEYDSQQNQKRIDDLTSSLGQIREELVAAKTTRDHLQSRADGFKIQLDSAEERIKLLQPQATPRPAAAVGPQDDINGDHVEGDLIREQELAIEVSELKRDLEIAKTELESSKKQMEQYKSISQSTEEELQSLNTTQDQYREEMDHIVEEKDTWIRELGQRVEDISSELTNTNNELTTLRNQQAEVARQAEEAKSALEAEITRLKDEDEKHATAAQYHQQDLRAQAAIATKAQQDYENELVKHAEAAKLLQNLRTEHNQLKSQTATLRSEAESAKITLSQSEASWEERREQFEQEMNELRTRRDDLISQNKILHQQLEDVGAQISALQQSRASADHSDSSPPESTNDRAADGLREVNSFLRREKEIIEVQYDLKMQEAKRLQQQLDYAQSQLDESRLKLDQERRLHADGNRNTLAHKELMDKLNELNLVRESSITLRNEARQAEARLAEKTKRVDELSEQIQPLEARIRELEHGKESMDGEMVLLQEDRDRWQKRTQDIISRYDRIDPQEMEQLKETIESLRSERDGLIAEKQPFQEQIQTLEAEKTAWSLSRTKLIDQAKERNRINMKDNKDRTAERDAAIQEKNALETQLTSLKEELETAITEKAAAEQQVISLGQEVESVKSERDRAIVSAATSSSQTQAAPTASEIDPIIEQQLTEIRAQLQQVSQDKQSLEQQLQNLQTQLEKANADRDAALAQAAEASTKQQTAQVHDTEVQNGAEEGQINETSNGHLADEERKVLLDRIAVAEAKTKEAEEKLAQLEATMEATLKARSDKMKTALNKKLAESKEAQKSELEGIYKLKLEQEKQIWLAESKATPAAPSSDPPADRKEDSEVSQAAVATPVKEGPKPLLVDPHNMSDTDIRDLIAKHPTARSIVVDNIKKQTVKIKDEHDKVIADMQAKSEISKNQAVLMEGKKSALRINMSENKIKLSTAKLEIVSKAASDTPQRPVVEVWEEAKAYKLPPPPPAPVVPQPAAATQSPAANPAVSTPTRKPSTVSAKVVSTPASTTGEVKSEVPSTQPSTQPIGQSTSQSSIPTVPNGANAPVSNIPVSNIPASNSPAGPQQNGAAPQRVSSIPTMRGGPAIRGRGNNQIYQPRGGQQGGRGRGGPQQQRGGLNAGAQNFSPTGPAGMKRGREDGTMGNPQQVKRPRGGGPN